MIQDAPRDRSPRRVLMTGATGLIGRALTRELSARGARLVALRRGAGESPRWDPARGELDPAIVEGFDAVIHLAGESLDGRFTARRRAEIRSSRWNGTRLLAQTLARAARPPVVMVSASAIGIYGDRGDEWLDERSAAGTGFLAEVVAGWEAAAAAASDAGIRAVHLRSGLVLAREGGALAPLVRLTRLALGGPLGNGRQWWSWIALPDLLGAFRLALDRDDLRGAVNVVAPEPCRQAEFARVLGRVLHRPARLPAPAAALRLVLGRGMADSLLLSSARVRPARLLEAGYAFLHPALEGALRAALQPELG